MMGNKAQGAVGSTTILPDPFQDLLDYQHHVSHSFVCLIFLRDIYILCKMIVLLILCGS
eukprot:c18101_g1_i3 orf=123-299(+)